MAEKKTELGELELDGVDGGALKSGDPAAATAGQCKHLYDCRQPGNSEFCRQEHGYNQYDKWNR